MANLISVDSPVLDRSGKQRGTDTISRPATPPDPATLPAINSNCVRVTCSCKRVYENVTQAKWDGWALAPREKNGVCGCVAYFNN